MKAVLVACLVTASPAFAGELDLNLGLQATQTQWDGDHGGGPSLGVSWFFKDWVGINFLGKEHYAPVDDRLMSYFSVNAIFRTSLGDRVRLAGTAGFVHQHEETRAAIEAMPLASAF